MTEINQDFEIYAGNDAILEIAITDSDNNDAPLSLSGTTITWVLYDDDLGSILITKTNSSITEINVTDPDHGLIEVYLTETDTENLNPTTTSYGHQVTVIDVQGNESTVTVGRVTVKRSYD